MKKRIFLLLVALILMLSSASCGNSLSDSETEGSLPSSVQDTEAAESFSESDMVTESETTEETEPQIVTETETKRKEKDVFEIIDFTVSVPEGREPVILQLTDPQIIDSAQCRTADRIGSTAKQYWGNDQKDARCYNYLREIIENTKPDLIILTGDIVYGEFDDSGESLVEFVEFMESFNIPWAPVFGNHENESKMGVDWQCAQFEAAKNCLFLQRSMTGNGNYTVGIEQGGELTRVFFMMDSNGCGNASEASLANTHFKTSPGFGTDQRKWYTKNINEITKRSPNTKISFAFHIQLKAFVDSLNTYVEGKDKVYIDLLENKREGDFGYISANRETGWDSDYTVWKELVALGVDSIFVGHVHSLSTSIVYEGVRLQYGMKCTAYDSINYLYDNGTIESSAYSTATPWLGGSVMKLSPSGEISDAYIYCCKDAGGEIDWEKFKPVPQEKVNGLQNGTDITLQSGISMNGIKFDETVNAYEVFATTQGKVYIDVNLLKNKSSFTFTVYVPSSSSAKLGGLGEFAIRTRPNEIEPEGDGTNDPNAHGGGYINYNSTQNNENYKIVFDTWQTFTVDISGFGEDCIEFSFVIANGNTIYLRDMMIE